MTVEAAQRPAGVVARGRMPALALLLFALGPAVAAASLLGPLGFGVIHYHVGDDVVNQVVGGDAIALALVAPAALAAGVLVWRGHPAGPLIALAPAGFSVYVYTQLAVAGEFASRPGNSERFFPLFLTVFLLGSAAFVLAWQATDTAAPPDPSPAMRQASAAVLWLVALFLTLGLHLRGLLDVIGGPPYAVEYTQSPAVFWIVKWMDLGIVVPVAIVTAVGVTRRRRWATRLMYAVVGWGALLGSAVAAMGVVMVAHDDPAASTAGTAVFVGLAVALLALIGWLLGPVFTAPTTGTPQVRRRGRRGG